MNLVEVSGLAVVGECPSEKLVPAFLQLVLIMYWGPWEKMAGT